MDFSFKSPISKNLILSHITETDIMSRYLNIPVKKGLFRSPLRHDARPTCSFFNTKDGTLLFKDFGIGKCYNCFTVVQTMYNCTYKQALEIIANDFDIINTTDWALCKKEYKNEIKKEREICKIQVRIQEFTNEELKWWQSFGITYNTLQHYNVHSCKYVFINNNLFCESNNFCPIFGYYGGKQNDIELWRCYFPMREENRFISNWRSNKIQGYEQLPENGELLVITKSMKDVMCLYGLGISACAPCSETLFIPEEMLQELKTRFKRIVCLYDNDRPGLQNMIKIRKSHPELIYTFIPFKYKSKDISDLYKKYGRKETKLLINDYLLWLKNN